MKRNLVGFEIQNIWDMVRKRKKLVQRLLEDDRIASKRTKNTALNFDSLVWLDFENTVHIQIHSNQFACNRDNNDLISQFKHVFPFITIFLM